MKNIHMFGISQKNGVKKAFFRPEKWHGFGAAFYSAGHTNGSADSLTAAAALGRRWLQLYAVRWPPGQSAGSGKEDAGKKRAVAPLWTQACARCSAYASATLGTVRGSKCPAGARECNPGLASPRRYSLFAGKVCRYCAREIKDGIGAAVRV